MFFSIVMSLLVILGDAANSTFQVGRIGLSSMSLALSDFYSANANYATRLVLHVRDSKGQAIDAAAAGIYMFFSNQNRIKLLFYLLMQICCMHAALSLLADVQVDRSSTICTSKFHDRSWRQSKCAHHFIFSNESCFRPSSSYFVRAALSDSNQVNAVAAIVRYFQWSQVVIVYQDSYGGNGMIAYPSNARVTYRSIIPLSATDDALLEELYKMKTMQTRVFVVHMSICLVASRFFPKVKQAGMMVEGYAWVVSLVTSGLLDLLFSLEPKRT